LGFLKLLHGSVLQTQRVKFGILNDPDPPYEVIKTRWLSFEDICKLKKCEEALEKLYNSGKFRRTLDLVFRQSGINPFELFMQMGEVLASHEGGLSQNLTTELFFSFMQKLPNISKGGLRDAMAFDRLSTDNTGLLPKCLHIPDERLGRALSQLKRELEPGTRLGACILYEGGERLLWTDYALRNPVTGEYAVRTRPL
jgi:hypothetical protein